MTARIMARIRAAVAFIVCGVLYASGAAPDVRPPNIVFILADDMGLGDVGCYGGTIARTPHIDRLASEGTRFERYYCSAPICSPSRAGLITGQDPARWRITSFLQTRAGNRGCEQDDFLDPRAPSLPRQLKSAGYATAHIGKWHLGGGRDVTNAPKFAAYGYEEHAGTYESPEPHPDITGTNWIWSPHDQVKRWDRTAFFVDKTIDFIRRHTNQPCFVNLWLDDPHTPWVPGADAPRGDTLRNLVPVLEELDRQIGRLAAGLAELGVETNTIVIFTSDNGPLPTFSRKRAAGLRGSKLGLYEGGLRMPFIVRWPGRTPAGRVDKETVLSGTDMFATLGKLAGARLPAGMKLDGEDLSDSFLGRSAGRRRPLFWEYGRNEQWFRYPRGDDRSPGLAVLEGDWKLLVNADGSSVELYNLSSDPKETMNVAADHDDLADRLKRAARDWRQALSAPSR